VAKLDPYEALQDAQSEARYESDPRAEPDKDEAEREREFAQLVDQNQGFRG
jgi:hypothetical protein